MFPVKKQFRSLKCIFWHGMVIENFHYGCFHYAPECSKNLLFLNLARGADLRRACLYSKPLFKNEVSHEVVDFDHLFNIVNCP